MEIAATSFTPLEVGGKPVADGAWKQKHPRCYISLDGSTRTVLQSLHVKRPLTEPLWH